MAHAELEHQESSIKPEQLAGWFNIESFQERLGIFTDDATHPALTEVAELLQRHYDDKSNFDEWTSWWYELPFLQKTALFTPIVSVAGLVGILVGLTIPFVLIASSLFYFLHDFATSQEQHRRDRGERFVAEATELTKKLDEMGLHFKSLANEMTSGLTEVHAQATTLAKSNAEMVKQTETLNEENKALQEMIATIKAQTEKMQAAQDRVTDSVDKVVTQLQSVDTELEGTTMTMRRLDDSIGQFTETAKLMHQTESNIGEVTRELGALIQQTERSLSDSTLETNRRFEDAIRVSQNVMAHAREKHTQSTLSEPPSSSVAPLVEPQNFSSPISQFSGVKPNVILDNPAVITYREEIPPSSTPVTRVISGANVGEFATALQLGQRAIAMARARRTQEITEHNNGASFPIQ